jgi:TPR repeat protein
MAAPAKSSQQDDTTAARSEHLGIPAKDDKLRAAKSVTGQTMAMIQPDMPIAQDPRSNGAVRALDPEEIKFLMAQGQQFISAGDVVTARIAFQRAAEAADADAALALGATYDPTVLVKLGVLGISADVVKARNWYQKAQKLGSSEARRRLDVLADR